MNIMYAIRDKDTNELYGHDTDLDDWYPSPDEVKMLSKKEDIDEVYRNYSPYRNIEIVIIEYTVKPLS